MENVTTVRRNSLRLRGEVKPVSFWSVVNSEVDLGLRGGGFDIVMRVGKW
jgi:hypothetical protein